MSHHHFGLRVARDTATKGPDNLSVLGVCLSEYSPDNGVFPEVLKDTKPAGHKNHVEICGVEFLKAGWSCQHSFNLGMPEEITLKVNGSLIILL